MRARIEAEKSELENFLMQLTDRLRDLDEHLRGAESARTASFQGGQQLEQRMHDEMGQIESGVRQASSLEQMKGMVRSRLDIIREHLEEHRRSEAQRQAELEQRLEHMTTRLRSVEQETTHLRAHLRKRKIQAMSDPLTGIANRTAFEDRLQREYGRWKRYRHPLGFAILDVDHFKQVNDNYGHKAGDRALKLIAQVLRQSLRETDFIARYGGEEFVALLPETGTSQVAEVAEKLRYAIETCSFHHRGERVPITLSVGYCEFRGDDSGEDAFQRADAALYRAKALGRNRCCGSESAESPRPGGAVDRR
ncbi:MAG: diguanylate cyclase [Comamonadaceae bacterium]|nr:diguanylate cyclase [Comamonadaceae bacterium]